ncbi:MAG: alpha/beta fold hydrolase, partial [Proteobacteria bacterium]|nr:alpha/beta fold hydrolase [Pseudomonadota bacterium]
MPYAQGEGARIYYEESGSGTPILFIHEFGGDIRSWEDQVRHFARGWRCVATCARGYPPSDAPRDPKPYGQDFSDRDMVAVLDAAGIAKAHVVGLSMGGYTALMLAAKYSDRVLSCTAAGAGSGSFKPTREAFIAHCREQAAEFERTGKIDAQAIGLWPARVQFANKDPVGWQRFVAQLAEHPA